VIRRKGRSTKGAIQMGDTRREGRKGRAKRGWESGD